MGLKHKICICIDEKTLIQVLASVREGRFRNKSHAFEYAVQRVIENGQ